MKYLEKQFKVCPNQSSDYDNNYNRIFRKTLKEKIKIIIDNILAYLFLK